MRHICVAGRKFVRIHQVYLYACLKYFLASFLTGCPGCCVKCVSVASASRPNFWHYRSQWVLHDTPCQLTGSVSLNILHTKKCTTFHSVTRKLQFFRTAPSNVIRLLPVLVVMTFLRHILHVFAVYFCCKTVRVIGLFLSYFWSVGPSMQTTRELSNPETLCKHKLRAAEATRHSQGVFKTASHQQRNTLWIELNAAVRQLLGRVILLENWVKTACSMKLSSGDFVANELQMLTSREASQSGRKYVWTRSDERKHSAANHCHSSSHPLHNEPE